MCIRDRKEGSDENKLMYAIRCLYYKIIKGMADNEQYENVTGFGLYDKEVVDLLRKYSGPTPNFRNMISEFGYKIDFVLYHQPKRKSGHSSYNPVSYTHLGRRKFVCSSVCGKCRCKDRNIMYSQYISSD